MGVDCYLFEGNDLYSLDRWYVFQGLFESGHEYDRDAMIEKFNLLLDEVQHTPDEDWEEKFFGGRDYYKKWIGEALEIVNHSKSNRFVFYNTSDVPEGFYDGGPKEISEVLQKINSLRKGSHE